MTPIIRSSLPTALVCLLLLAGPAVAQTGSILGRVTSTETGAPIENATVQVRSSGGGLAGSSLTNNDGRYRVAGLQPGSYSVTVSTVGHGTRTLENIQVVADQAANGDIAMDPVALNLDPVVVSVGKQPEKALNAPARVEVVPQAEIEARPTVNPVDHLRNTPAVDVISSGVQSSFVVVRGFNNIFSGALHTLTDNRIAGVPSLRVNLMHFIPQTNEDISRMEVVLGPGSALYGPNTANGVLHIITKSPFEEQGTTFSMSGGEQSLLHGTFRTAHMLSDRFGFKVSGQYVSANEWEYQDPVELATKNQAITDPATFRANLPLDVDGTPLTDAEVAQRIDRIANRDFDIRRWSVDARADWYATPTLNIDVSAGRTTSVSGIELTGIGAGQAKDWAYSYYQARARTGRLFAQAYLNTSDAGETFLLRTGGPIIDRSKVFVSQLQHGLSTWRGRQRFTYGADYVSTMPETERTINGSNEDDDNYQEIGGYLQSETDLSRMFSLTLAGRVDKHSELDDAVWSPRAALVFKPAEDHSLRVTYNRAFSTPTSLNLFLDIDGGPAGALGPLGFRVRAQAPGNHGFSFRNASGDLYGIRSPFAATFQQTPRDILPISNAAAYNLQITGFAAAAAGQGQPVPAAIIAALRSFANDPAFAALGLSTLNPSTGARTPLGSSVINDVPGIKESITNAFEVGYKGIIGGRVLLAADVWHERKTNFTSPLIVQTPLLLMTPEQLAPFIVQRLTPLLVAQGLPPAQAQAQATAIATNLVQIPAGIVSSPDMNALGADLLATYVNFGEIDLTGVDLSAQALLTDNWSLGVNASFVSDDHFIVPLAGQEDQIVALNAPRKKASANIGYRNRGTGLTGEFRVRYTDEFPVNSADFVGLGCVAADVGINPNEAGECVKSYTLFDLSAGYAFPTVPGASVTFTIQNLFNEAYTSFVGVPPVGRLGMVRFRYAFGGRR